MTVCIATDGFFPQTGGIATFNGHLSSLLIDAGHKVIVLYIGYDTEEEDSITTEGNLVKVVLKRSFQAFYKQWQPYFRPGGFDAPNWIAIGSAMKEWLLKNHNDYHIDIIEVSDYGGAGIFLCDDSLPPVVITGHGCLSQLLRYNYVRNDDHVRIVKKLERLSFAHANAVIAHSPLNKTDLEQLFQREISQITIPWKPEIIRKGPSTESCELLVIGSLQPAKGIYDSMEALLLLQDKAPEIKLNWIGGDTWLAPGHQLMSAYLQQKYPGVWQKNFNWIKELPHTEVMEAIQTAGMVIIPAVFETFNYIAAEAAACRKPIIITEGAGAAYLFTHEKDAWIIPEANPAALAKAILRLRNQPALRRSLGDHAYQAISGKFIPEKIVSERLAVYEKVIKEKRATPGNTKLHLSFLAGYRTSRRKYYYCIRRLIKKLVGRA